MTPLKMQPNHADRLMVLAMFLATVPPQKFDISSWAEHAGGDNLDDGDIEVLGVKKIAEDQKIKPTVEQIAHTCGTTACALGYAGSLPQFQKEGLELVAKVYGNQRHTYVGGIEVPEGPVTCYVGGSDVEYHTTTPSGKKTVKHGFSAGAAFFGLTRGESENLFNPDRYSDPTEPRRDQFADYDAYCEACDDWSCKDVEYTPQPIDVTNKIEKLLRKYGYMKQANRVATCPVAIQRKWANQFGTGTTYQVMART